MCDSSQPHGLQHARLHVVQSGFHVRPRACACVGAKSLQSYLTLWDPVDRSPLDSKSYHYLKPPVPTFTLLPGVSLKLGFITSVLATASRVPRVPSPWTQPREAPSPPRGQAEPPSEASPPEDGASHWPLSAGPTPETQTLAGTQNPTHSKSHWEPALKKSRSEVSDEGCLGSAVRKRIYTKDSRPQRASSRPRDRTRVTCVSCPEGGFFPTSPSTPPLVGTNSTPSRLPWGPQPILHSQAPKADLPIFWASVLLQKFLLPSLFFFELQLIELTLPGWEIAMQSRQS